MGDGWAGAVCLPAADGAGGQAAEGWALRSSKARPGELVAIQGVGGLGHLGIQFARRMVFESRPLLADRKRKVSRRNSGHIITLTPRFKSETKLVSESCWLLGNNSNAFRGGFARQPADLANAASMV